MRKIDSRRKAKLSELLAIGHRRFGLVAPRHPYKDDDDEGGGAGGAAFEPHPLLSNEPIGVPSEMNPIVAENSRALEEAENRLDEFKLTMQNRLKNELGLGARKQFSPTPSPLGR